jgi:hypothetical protein
MARTYAYLKGSACFRDKKLAGSNKHEEVNEWHFTPKDMA